MDAPTTSGIARDGPPQTVRDPDIDALFLRYAEGFDDFDAERVIECFRFPVTIWQDGAGHVFETGDELTENVEALFAVFEGEDVVGSEFTVLSQSIAENAAFVSLAWSQRRADGEAALDFSCNYSLVRLEGDSWRIALAVLA